MSWRLVRGIWVTVCNLSFLGLMGVGFLQDHEISNFKGGTRPPSTVTETLVPILLVTLLVIGIVLEWLDWTWPALALNGGFFAFFGFGVLGKVLWMALTKASANGEAGLALAIVGVPCTLIAVLDLFLYWNTRT
jgi:multisubunit Na+/H+ antiporter MnhB subunit